MRPRSRRAATTASICARTRGSCSRARARASPTCPKPRASAAAARWRSGCSGEEQDRDLQTSGSSSTSCARSRRSTTAAGRARARAAGRRGPHLRDRTARSGSALPIRRRQGPRPPQERRHPHLPRARHRLPRGQARPRLRPVDRRLGRRPPRLHPADARGAPRARLPGGVLRSRAGAAGQGEAGRRRGQDVEARGRVRHPARPLRRGRGGRRALLLPDAEGRHARSISTSISPSKQTDENPVFYVQMAHARMSGIFRDAPSATPEAVTGDARPRRAARAAGHRAAEEAGRLSRGRGAAPPASGSRTGSPSTRTISPRAVHGWYHHTRVVGAPGARPPSAPGCCWRARRASCSPTASRCSASPPRIGCDLMSLLVVGSIALDSVFTPFGETADALGGSAVYFSVAGSLLHPVQVVGVVGSDYPRCRAGARSAPRGIDWSGVERAEGESFRWKGKYSYDLQSRETLETRLGVFADFQPKLPAGVPGRRVPLPRQHRSRAPARRAGAGAAARAGRVRHDELLDPEQEGRAARAADAGRHPHGQRRRGARAERRLEHPPRRRGGSWRTAQAGGHQAGRARRAPDRARAAPSTSRPFRWRRCSTRPARATPSPAGSWATWRGPIASPRTTSAARWSYGAAMGSLRGGGVRHPRVRRTSRCRTCEAPGARLPGPHARRARGGARVTSPASTPRRASTSRAPTRPRRGSAELVAGTRTALSVGKVGAFGGMVRVPAGHAAAGARAEHRRRRHQGAGGARRPAGSTPWARTWSTTASTTSWCTAPRPLAFMDYIAGAGLSVEQIAGSVEGVARGCRAHEMALAGGETAQMPGLYQPGNFDLAGTIVGVVEEDARSTATPSARATCCWARVDRTPHQRLYAGPAHRVRADGPRGGRPLARTGTTRGGRAARGAPQLLPPACRRCSPGSTGWPTSPAAGIAGNLVRVLPDGCEAVVDSSAWSCRRCSPRCSTAGGVSPRRCGEVFNLGVGMIAVAAARTTVGHGSGAAARRPPSRPGFWARFAGDPRAVCRTLSGSRDRARGHEPRAGLALAGLGPSAAQSAGRRSRAAGGPAWSAKGYHAEYGGRARRAIGARGRRARCSRARRSSCTLEPCDHRASSRPCTEAMLAAGVARVVAAVRDPNPVARGRDRRLARCRRGGGAGTRAGRGGGGQNAVLSPRMRTASLRGPEARHLAWTAASRTPAASRAGSRGEAARDSCTGCAPGFDAIGVGGVTARADDPSLTVRGAGGAATAASPHRFCRRWGRAAVAQAGAERPGAPDRRGGGAGLTGGAAGAARGRGCRRHSFHHARGCNGDTQARRGGFDPDRGRGPTRGRSARRRPGRPLLLDSDATLARGGGSTGGRGAFPPRRWAMRRAGV